MTVKFDNFVLALRQLCSEHAIQLAASGYDDIHVWNKGPAEEEIYCGIKDFTNDGTTN